MKIKLAALCLLLFFTGCGALGSQKAVNNSGAETLTISAAASLRDAFGEIGELFKNRAGVAVNFNFGSSGALQKQIEAGAPVDVFASAGEKQMDELAAKNLLIADSRTDFARNTLVLVVPADSKVEINSFADLAKPEFRKIAAGNSKTVPAGQYCEQALARLNLTDNVSPRLIFAEDVRQVLDYVARGEVDAGLVYATDAQPAGSKVRVAATAPEDSHDPILYPIVVIKDSKNVESARQFTSFVSGPEGQAVLKKYGFGVVTK